MKEYSPNWCWLLIPLLAVLLLLVFQLRDKKWVVNQESIWLIIIILVGVAVIIMRPTSVSTGFGTLERKVERLSQNIRPYLIFDGAHVVRSTFEHGDIEILPASVRQMALTSRTTSTMAMRPQKKDDDYPAEFQIIFRKRPAFYEIRNSHGASLKISERTESGYTVVSVDQISSVGGSKNEFIIEATYE